MNTTTKDKHPLLHNPDGSPKWKNPDTVWQHGDHVGIPLSKGESAHTPGPWEYKRGWANGGFVIENVAHITNEADAKLIAAAPETAAERDRLQQALADTSKNIGDARRQRDELLAVWRRVDEAYETLSDGALENAVFSMRAIAASVEADKQGGKQ